MNKHTLSSQDSYTGIHLFNQTSHHLPFNREQLEHIANCVSKKEQCAFLWLEVVFVDEAEITRINHEHLERDYVTDIISFRYDEAADNQAIEGTLYCCAPRIAAQAKEFGEPEAKEFQRIIIHGLLHLADYEDTSPEDRHQMTQKEDFYLAKLSHI